MTKKEIIEKLDEQYKAWIPDCLDKKLSEQYKTWIPDCLDPSIQTLMRIAMNQAFVFGVKTSVDADFYSLKEVLSLIDDWEHQFDID